MIQLHSGRITSSSGNGMLYLKLTSDVRLTLCMSLSLCIDRLLACTPPNRLIVDLVDADHIDSTTMGLLARLAIRYRIQFGQAPALWCRLDYAPAITAMSLDEVYAMETFSPGEIPPDMPDLTTLQHQSFEDIAANDAEIAGMVSEAHRVLMALNPEKAESFTPLLAALRQHS